MADFSVITLGRSLTCAAVKHHGCTQGGFFCLGFSMDVNGDVQQEKPQISHKMQRQA